MLYCNIIHRTCEEALSSELIFQQDTAHEFGFKTTLMATYSSFWQDDVIQYYKDQNKKYKDEIGYFCQPLEGEKYKELTGTDDPFWLLNSDIKKKYINSAMNLFKETYGYYPKSIAAYYFDAETLLYIKNNFPSVKIAIVNCFDEGVHMYTGCLNSWYLFTEGGPWSAYYPSKINSMCPAESAEDSIGIIGVPHLNRDMLLSYTSRDDYYSSHTVNMQRGKVNKGTDCRYIYDFLDEWIKQAEYNNGHAYYNLYAGPSWLSRGYEGESDEVCRNLYRQAIAYYRKKSDEGSLTVLTMGEYADWHAENVAVNNNDVILWKDLLCKSKRQMFWAVNSSYRAAIDPNVCGAVVDLRPYAGKISCEIGADSENLWDSSYPFALSSEHRNSFYTCEIEVKGIKTNLLEYRTTAEIETNANKKILRLMPKKIEVGDTELVIQTIYTVDDSNVIQIERKLISSSAPNEPVAFTEIFKGCYGTTQYPMNLKGTMLSLKDKDKNTIHKIIYEHKQRKYKSENAHYAACTVPMLKTEFVLHCKNNFDYMEIEEGRMFEPYYTLKGTKIINTGESADICLTINKI